MTDQTLVWLDLETTGFFPQLHLILEVAVSLAALHDPFNVTPVYHAVLSFPRAMRPTLDLPVLEMHTRNGLLDECAASTVTCVEAEAALVSIIPDVACRDDRPILAGSSVHFDHEFIAMHMPLLNRRLLHRHYDVSGLKLYCESMGMPRFRKAEAHRARADVIESVQHGRECTQWLSGSEMMLRP